VSTVAAASVAGASVVAAASVVASGVSEQDTNVAKLKATATNVILTDFILFYF
jgi:hypothetical protein